MATRPSGDNIANAQNPTAPQILDLDTVDEFIIMDHLGGIPKQTKDVEELIRNSYLQIFRRQAKALPDGTPLQRRLQDIGRAVMTSRWDYILLRDEEDWSRALDETHEELRKSFVFVKKLEPQFRHSEEVGSFGRVVKLRERRLLQIKLDKRRKAMLINDLEKLRSFEEIISN